MFLEYCEQNNIEKVKFYLELGANVNYKCCRFNCSALKYAVKNNSEDLLDLLLSQPGVDVNVTSGRNGYTALTSACELNRVNIVKRLCQVSEINPNIKTKFDDSALLIAIYDNNIECVKILRTVIKTDWNIRNGDGEYPIITSLIYGQIDIFEIILSVTELDLSVTDDKGRNIVQIAIQHRNNEVSQRAVEILSRDKRVNCWNDKDKYGNTPLMYCLKLNKEELVQSLINT